MSILALALLGGVLALDGMAVGQFMISRPLVAGLLAGMLAGDPATGAAVGAVLEIYMLVGAPTGGARFPEPGPATVVGVALAVVAGGATGLALGVGAALVMGKAGGISQALQRRVAGRLVPVPGEGPITPRRVVASHLAVIAVDFTRGAVLTGLGVWAVLFLGGPAARLWPLDVPSSRALALVGAFVSLGILVRGEVPGARRLLLFGSGVGIGLLAGSVLAWASPRAVSSSGSLPAAFSSRARGTTAP
jgi:PTS system sorbose-specific iic component